MAALEGLPCLDVLNLCLEKARTFYVRFLLGPAYSTFDTPERCRVGFAHTLISNFWFGNFLALILLQGYAFSGRVTLIEPANSTLATQAGLVTDCVSEPHVRRF
jgi:hypothetical protein